MLCHLPIAAAIGAELKAPDVPFQDTGITADMRKAQPVIDRDGVQIGNKSLRVSGGFNFTRFLDKGKVVLELDGRIDPAPKWDPFEKFATSFDEGQQTLLNECPFEMVDGKKGTFREQIRMTPDGKIALEFRYDTPEDVKEKPWQVLTISVPTTFLLGKKIRIDGHEPIQLPEDAEAFVKAKFPENGGGIGETRRMFSNARKLVLAADDPKNTFALEFSPAIVRVNLNPGKTTTQIGLGYGKRCEPFTVTLDPGNCFQIAKTDCVVGGVNYTQNNAFEAAVFDENRNVLMNPSFESGAQYWKVSSGHGDLNEMLCPSNAHSGKYCINIRPASGSGPATLKSVGTIVYPDTDYTISAWIKAADGKRAGLSIHPRGPGGPGNWAKAGGVETKEPHGQWQRVRYTFKTTPNIHNLVIWLSSGGTNLIADDFQLERGSGMTDYAGNKIGMELLAGSPDRQVVDAKAPIRARLLFRAAPGQTGSVDISVTDFFGRKLLEKTERLKIGASGEQVVRIGPDSLFPMGTVIVKTMIRAEGQKAYTDFRRLIRIPYADNTAKHKTLQSSGPYLFSSSLSHCPESLCRFFRAFGIGAFSYTQKLEGRETEAEHAVMGKYGIVDFWGGVLWNVNWKDMINGQPWAWNGEPVQRLESYPPEFLKWAEEMAYAQTTASPWIGYWSMPTEPMGVYKTLQQGNFKEYAKLTLAINRGIMRANPNALFCPFGVWNLFAQGRNDEYAFYRAASELEPQTTFKVVDSHSYRSFPESPDVEEDLLAFMDGLAKIGYPDVKIKIGEGSYYYPMIAPEFNLAPWTGVGTKDGYYDVAIPSYDLGWGERIGAAQVTRETLVYYKHADRVINNCSWCPPFIDNRTPISWWAANAALIDMLGNADFKEDIRFASYSRAYLFEDPKGRTIAAVWKFDEKFDRGLVGGTTMALKLERGAKPEFIDLMGNVCDVPRRDGKYQVPLSGFPVYIRVAKGKGAHLSQAISTCEVAADDKALPLQFSATVQTRTAASVKVINPLSRLLEAEVGIAGGALKPVTAQPKSAEAVTVELPKPVSDGGFDNLDIPIRIRFKGRDYSEDFKAAALAVHRVKEGFAWSDIPSVSVPHLHVTGKNHKWKGKADFSALCQFAWNENGLYMRFEVEDDAFVCPEKGTPWGAYWDYDSIQLFFDSFGDAREKVKKGITGFDTNDFSYELLPDSPDSAVTFRRIAPDIQLTGGAMHAFEANVLEKSIACAFKYGNGKRIYDAVFPLRTLMPIPLKEGTSFGFGFEIYDRDDAKIGAPQKLSNVPASACGQPHLYPQLILMN